MASKRKKDSLEQNLSTPVSKIAKTEEVTRSGRVRKRPAKFSDVEPEEESEETTPKSEPSTPVLQKSVESMVVAKVPIKTEPINIQTSLNFQSPVAQKTTAKSPKTAAAALLTTLLPEVKPEMPSTSPDSADDVSKTPSRGGRMRKKSAKVLEMEEFEEAERKTQSKKAPATLTEPAKKPGLDTAPVPLEVLPPKKAYKASANVPQLVTAALAAKIASSTLPTLKIKDIPVSPKAQAAPVKTEVVSPIKIKTEAVSPVKGKSSTQVSPRSVANTIRLDQVSEQDKGSVIKLLLSSPAQATNPVLSTKSVAGTSPPVEKPAGSTKKKSKGKEKVAAVLETSPTDLPNLKLALSTHSSVPPSARIAVDPNLIKQEQLPVSVDSQQHGLKLKFVLSPEGAASTAASSQPLYQTSPIKTEPVKTEPMTPPPKSATKAKKSRKASGNEVPIEQDMKFISSQMITPNVVHVQNAPSTSGLITDDHHLPPKKKKSAKVKIENVEEPEKSMMDSEFDIDLSALGGAGDESLMDLDDDGLMISEEDLEHVKPVKSAKKKKTKVKGSAKKGTVQLGDIPSSTESELVMDLERMKQDDRKKKKQTKAAAVEVEQTKKKRAPTAYMLWCSANRQRVVHDNPGIDFSTISKTLGEMWSGLSDKDKMMWKRKAKKAGGKGSTLIQTGKTAALAAAKQQAQAQPIPIRHGGHNPNSQKVTAAMTAAMLTKAAKQATEDAPVKGFGADPVDVAAHLKIVGESLSIIGMRLQEHRGLIAVQGSLSVLLDSMLCAMGPLLCLTNQLEELNGCSHQTHMKTLDNIAYFMPGL